MRVIICVWWHGYCMSILFVMYINWMNAFLQLYTYFIPLKGQQMGGKTYHNMVPKVAVVSERILCISGVYLSKQSNLGWFFFEFMYINASHTSSLGWWGKKDDEVKMYKYFNYVHIIWFPSPDGVYTLIHCRDMKLGQVMGHIPWECQMLQGWVQLVYKCVLGMYISYVFADSLLLCT